MRVFAMHGAVLSIESTHLGTLNLRYKILPLSSCYHFLITFKTTNSTNSDEGRTKAQDRNNQRINGFLVDNTEVEVCLYYGLTNCDGWNSQLFTRNL